MGYTGTHLVRPNLSFTTKHKKMAKVYEFSEVQKHNTEQSCWFVVDDKVYGVTTFFDEHPGGQDFLMKYAGDDATFEFYDVGHSPGAIEILPEYEIGTLKESCLEALKTKRAELTAAQDLEKQKGGGGGCQIL